VQVYALTSSHLRGETLDLFLTREAAQAELREILQDEPGWVDVLRVEPIRLDAQRSSSNSLVPPRRRRKRRQRQEARAFITPTPLWAHGLSASSDVQDLDLLRLHVVA
jgi:hypothetical protein